MADETSNAEPLWTAEEVADYLRVAETTVSQWAKIGRIPVVKVGTLNRFKKSEIDRWLASNSKPVTEEVA